MKIIIFTFFCSLLILSFSQPLGQSTYTIDRPEGKRTYYVYLPSQYSMDKNLPIHITFHGLSEDAVGHVQSRKLISYAEQYGYILVYPQGFTASTVKLLSQSAWNAGTCCFSIFSRGNIDDFQFFELIIQDLAQKNIQYNPQEMYLSGMSNGAMMVEVLACKFPSRFKAVASICGVVDLANCKKALDMCDNLFSQKQGSVSLLNVHGTSDIQVPWNGIGIAFLAGIIFPTIPDDLQRWAQRNNCSTQSRQTFQSGTFSNQIWDNNCRDNVKVELVKNQGGQHEWIINQDFDTSAYIMKFFGFDKN